jgi:hypothetical protein
LLAAAAAQHREAIAKRYAGAVKDKTGRLRSRADMVIALMPTTKMREWPPPRRRYMEES